MITSTGANISTVPKVVVRVQTKISKCTLNLGDKIFGNKRWISKCAVLEMIFDCG